MWFNFWGEVSVHCFGESYKTLNKNTLTFAIFFFQECWKKLESFELLRRFLQIRVINDSIDDSKCLPALTATAAMAVSLCAQSIVC